MEAYIAHGNKNAVPQNSNILLGCRYLIFFVMLYMSIMICSAILTNRYIKLNGDIFVLGGTLVSPLIFILGDIVAEIFGCKVAKQMIWCGFICQLVFAIICGVVVKAPFPIFFKEYYPYSFVFGQLLYIVTSSFFAFIISNLVNVYIITKWKILLRGRYFWLRSLGSSTIAEALYSIIAIFIMEIGLISFSSVWKLVLTSYLIKVIYSIAFAWPGNMIVNYIKNTTKIDVYDDVKKYNPFKLNKNNPLHAQSTN